MATSRNNTLVLVTRFENSAASKVEKVLKVTLSFFSIIEQSTKLLLNRLMVR